MDSNDEGELYWKVNYDGRFVITQHLADVTAMLENEISESIAEGQNVLIERVRLTQREYESLPEFDGF